MDSTEGCGAFGLSAYGEFGTLASASWYAVTWDRYLSELMPVERPAVKMRIRFPP